MTRSPRRALVALAVAGLLGVPAAGGAAAAPAPLAPLEVTTSPVPGPRSDVGGDRLQTNGLVVPAGAPAVPPGLTAAAWVVADLETGEVLGARDPHGRYAPASTLKTLTALTAIPRLRKDRWVTATYDDVAVEGSKVGLVEGGRYTVQQLLTALMINSGNDAANSLASALGGQETMASLMNAEAARLGAADTHVVNPHGLDAEGQVSSAYDLALIAREGMGLADFAWYAQVRRASIPAPGGTSFQIYNHNKLLTRGYEGALGIKNGYTSRARASFVGAAERGGRRLVATVMRSQPRAWQEAAALLDWGFAAAAAGVEPVGELVEPRRDAEALLAGPSASPTSDAAGAAGATRAAGARSAGPPAAPAPSGGGDDVLASGGLDASAADGGTSPALVLLLTAVTAVLVVVRVRWELRRRARRSAPGRA